MGLPPLSQVRSMECMGVVGLAGSPSVMNSIVDDGGILPALTDEILVHRLQLLPVVVVRELVLPIRVWSPGSCSPNASSLAPMRYVPELPKG